MHNQEVNDDEQDKSVCFENRKQANKLYPPHTQKNNKQSKKPRSP